MEFEVKRQLTVALQNQPGRLAEISELIARHGITIEALCVIDNVDQGVARLLVDNPARCKELLIDHNLGVVEAEVIALHLTDRRGKLAAVTKALAATNINIDYAYSTVDHAGSHALLVLKVSNSRMAESVLGTLADD